MISFVAIIAAGALPAVAAPDKDPTLENAVRLLSRAMHETKDAPLTKSAEAGLVITALRSAKDKDLLPLFDKLRQSKSLDNQIYAMISVAVLSKDPKKVDLPLLFSMKDSGLVGSAIATLIDTEVMTTEQLETIAADAPDEVYKAMAVGELSRRKALKDRSLLAKLLKSNQDVVRYYTAITVLETKDAPETADAMTALRQMSELHELRQAPVQAMMIVRVQKENITAAGPWLVQLAGDEKNDEGLRYTAAGALLGLKNPDGPRLLGDMIQKQRDTIQQVKLGLIALEDPTVFKTETLAPLAQSRSQLAKTIGVLAQQGTGGADIETGLVDLIKKGHPIVLDWALVYSDRAAMAKRLPIRAAIISQANIVDQQRGRDYERAAIAAQRILEDATPEGRKMIVSLLKSDNYAVVEAVLAGIYRSGVANESELVTPVWEALSKSSSQETATNYAAMILAREGRKESATWLSGMVLGGTVQNPGFRVLAGWYYAKLLGQSDVLLRQALAD